MLGQGLWKSICECVCDKVMLLFFCTGSSPTIVFFLYIICLWNPSKLTYTVKKMQSEYIITYID